jgi:Holin of 3TMs, for gene-transfer release
MGALLALIDPVAKIIDRVIPDKTAAAAAKAELLSDETKGEINNALAQIQTNQAEAASKSIFVAGWRPFVGWVCGVAFAYVYVLQPFAQFMLVAFRVNFDVAKLPVINISDMMPVLLGMLGLGAMRSYDKNQGTGNGH